MAWTYHPDELDGLGADAIATMLYELFQAAYERIGYAMYFASDFRAALTAHGPAYELVGSSYVVARTEVLESDYLEYHLPKYNGELVTDPEIFNGIPLQATDILDIVQVVTDSLSSYAGFGELVAVWPNDIPIALSEFSSSGTPETILDSRYWRTVVAYVNSFRRVFRSKTNNTLTSSSASQHTVPFGYYPDATMDQSGQLQSIGQFGIAWTLDVDHITSGSSTASAVHIYGFTFSLDNVSVTEDNWVSEVVPAWRALSIPVNKKAPFALSLLSHLTGGGHSIVDAHQTNPWDETYADYTDATAIDPSRFALSDGMYIGEPGTHEANQTGIGITMYSSGFNSSSESIDIDYIPGLDADNSDTKDILDYYVDLDQPEEEFIPYTY